MHEYGVAIPVYKSIIIIEYSCCISTTTLLYITYFSHHTNNRLTPFLRPFPTSRGGKNFAQSCARTLEPEDVTVGMVVGKSLQLHSKYILITKSGLVTGTLNSSA